MAIYLDVKNDEPPPSIYSTLQPPERAFYVCVLIASVLAIFWTVCLTGFFYLHYADIQFFLEEGTDLLGNIHGYEDYVTDKVELLGPQLADAGECIMCAIRNFPHVSDCKLLCN